MVSRATDEGVKGSVTEKIFLASIIKVGGSTLSCKKFYNKKEMQKRCQIVSLMMRLIMSTHSNLTYFNKCDKFR